MKDGVDVDKSNKEEYTPLLRAVEKGHLQLVEYLILIEATTRKRANLLPLDTNFKKV